MKVGGNVPVPVVGEDRKKRLSDKQKYGTIIQMLDN